MRRSLVDGMDRAREGMDASLGMSTPYGSAPLTFNLNLEQKLKDLICPKPDSARHPLVQSPALSTDLEPPGRKSFFSWEHLQFATSVFLFLNTSTTCS